MQTTTITPVNCIVQRFVWPSLLADPSWCNADGWEIPYARSPLGAKQMGVSDPLATTSVCQADDGNFGCLVVTQLGVQTVCLFVVTVSPSPILWTATPRTTLGLPPR